VCLSTGFQEDCVNYRLAASLPAGSNLELPELPADHGRRRIRHQGEAAVRVESRTDEIDQSTID